LSARITSWSVVNLVDDAIVTAQAARCAVIFCRNLFIYFSDKTIRSVVERLADSMPNPGYLCIGASESLLRITNRFCLEEIGGAFVYVRQP
jgi:chemotaxis protein methyltransferase CheR